MRGLPDTALPEIDVRILDPRLPGWGFPHWGSALAAGLDLNACHDTPLVLAPGSPATLISAGFSLRIGEAGWCAILAPRSGLGHRGLILGNTIGVIDADYEGPVAISIWNRSDAPIAVTPGDRIAQMLFVRTARPRLRMVEAFAASNEGARGSGGFGSTGVAPVRHGS